ncbi:MAG: two-component system sensor histidine kinase PilS (NtrC family) [Candidatus Endobugula sp.]|jgi:two-component system sensor histidine kinase PilS (NtrC family)
MLNYITNDDNQRLFSIYVYYRFAMSAMLTALFLLGFGGAILGVQSPLVFVYTGCLYIFLCGLSVAMLLLGKLPSKSSNIVFILVIDFILLTQMIFTSDSIIGALGYLLLIPMAIGGTFLRGKTSIALAAFASLFIIFNSIINSFSSSNSNEYLLAAALTGTVLFATAITFHLLSKKLERSEEQTAKQSMRAEHLQGISQKIIETFQSGIVVIDDNNALLLINHAAEKFLTNNLILPKLEEVPKLNNALLLWKKTHQAPKKIVIANANGGNIKISFTQLIDNNINALMLFMEDEKHIQQQVQQIKLASLGRLTSSIAHEIRNPLSAISHASQLLDESENISPSDQELLRMIQVNSQRIDQTINNILQFSRRKQSSPEMINLCEWLNTFKVNYQSHEQSAIVIVTAKQHIYGRIDPNHLQQIISNLVDNALRHSQKKPPENIISLEVHIDSSTNLPYIDIIDEGNGISEADLDSIFEPFFTTKPQGSGLGLYLCKELCEANQTNILYLRKTLSQKSCFRLIFNNSTQKTINNDK